MADQDTHNSDAKESSTLKTKNLSAHKIVKQPVHDFLDFLRGQGVVGLAVGFVIGTQVQVVVKQLLQSFIDPFLGLLMNGSGALSAKVYVLNFHGKTAQFQWGAFVYTLLDFVLVVAILYFIIRSFRLDKLDKKKS